MHPIDGAKVGTMDGFTTGAREVGTIEGDDGATVGAVVGPR